MKIIRHASMSWSRTEQCPLCPVGRNRFHQAQQPYFCGCQWQVCVADEFHFPSRSCRSPEVLQSICAPQPACRHPQGMPVSTVEGNGVHLRRQSAFHAPASHPPRAGGLPNHGTPARAQGRKSTMNLKIKLLLVHSSGGQCRPIFTIDDHLYVQILACLDRALADVLLRAEQFH